jgi:beta-glucanase (GH16 family)
VIAGRSLVRLRWFALAVGAVAAVGIAVVVAAGLHRSRPAAAVRPPHHWRRVFTEDFRRGLRPARWGRYSGQPAGDPGGWWAPSHAVVRHGILELRTYRDPRFGGRWVSGGVSSAPALRQRYGRYRVRFRADPGRGVAVVLLLMASANHWPPEIDFAENGGMDTGRRTMAATLHYGVEPHDHQTQRIVHGDFAQWHTMGITWTPRRLVYTLDGRGWATVRGAKVPHERMELDLQAQAGTCGDRWAPCPGASTPAHVTLRIDRVTVDAYRPGRRPPLSR